MKMRKIIGLCMVLSALSFLFLCILCVIIKMIQTDWKPFVFGTIMACALWLVFKAGEYLMEER